MVSNRCLGQNIHDLRRFLANKVLLELDIVADAFPTRLLSIQTAKFLSTKLIVRLRFRLLKTPSQRVYCFVRFLIILS
jgi:hypothetical protein